MNEVKQVIVLRKDLWDSVEHKGKMVTQGAHGSVNSAFAPFPIVDDVITIDLKQFPYFKEWLTGQYKKITVYVKNEEQLFKLLGKLKEQSAIPYALIHDNGLTEFDGKTYTGLAIGPYESNAIDVYTKRLRLL